MNDRWSRLERFILRLLDAAGPCDEIALLDTTGRVSGTSRAEAFHHLQILVAEGLVSKAGTADKGGFSYKITSAGSYAAAKYLPN